MTSDREARVAVKDLCLDATDPPAAAAFWAPVLNLTATAREGGDFVLTDEVDEHTLWVNRVTEPKTVKHRVHLDVRTVAIDDLTALGARVLDEQPHWTLMADPEDGEFCAFLRTPDKLPRYRLYEVVVDAEDPERITSWWADRLALAPQRGDEGAFWYLESPDLPWSLVFQSVPEPKTVKNRLHWDVWGTTEELLAAGATQLRARDDEVRWDVLADPEGNEFCVFARPHPSAPEPAE